MENATAKLSSLKGHDPLENMGTSETLFTQDSTKLQVQNILKCYTHFYDVFAESIQNALDAVEAGAREKGSEPYQPRLWIRVDMQGRTIRVVDNGVGMGLEQFKYCFRPNVSFKKNGEYRGQKGVGATFLAYGFSFVKLQSKCQGEKLAAVLRGGRLWANDSTGRISRPLFESADWDVAELQHEPHGTCIEITIGREPGERPGDLGWLNATTADQWRDLLRIKTPLGQIYLTGGSFAPTVTVEVIDSAGHRTVVPNCKTEYYYPEEIPGIRVADLDDLIAALVRIEGDAQTKMRKLDDQYKRLNCLRKIWTSREIIDPRSSLRADELTQDEIALCQRHDVTVYAAFVNSLDVWDKFSDETLVLRKKQRVLKGGLQMASDHMVQGDLIPIPLLRAVGYQHQCHTIVHFTNGNPDLGRKVFQPEYQQLAEKLAKGAVHTFIRYRTHLRPDTGTAQMLPDRELQNWMREQEDWRRHEALKVFPMFKGLSLVSNPREEQDVVALFHELAACGVLKGYNFLSATCNDRYDALFELNL